MPLPDSSLIHRQATWEKHKTDKLISDPYVWLPRTLSNRYASEGFLPRTPVTDYWLSLSLREGLDFHGCGWPAPADGRNRMASPLFRGVLFAALSGMRP